jgi:hypothetical protein
VTDLSTAEQIIHLEGGPLNGQAFEGCFLGRRLVWPDDRADGGDYLLTLVKSAGPTAPEDRTYTWHPHEQSAAA